MKERIEHFQSRKYHLYCGQFHFFQSKPINMLMSDRKVEHVIHYHDLEFYDEEIEYLKRYYNAAETLTRVTKLISYYQNNMTPPNPNLIPVEAYTYLENRYRKIMKLCLMKEKSLAKRTTSQDKDNCEILKEIDQSNFSDFQDEDNSAEESYDASAHNMYAPQDSLSKGGFSQKIPLYESIEDMDENEMEVFNTRDQRVDMLIIDLKPERRSTLEERLTSVDKKAPNQNQLHLQKLKEKDKLIEELLQLKNKLEAENKALLQLSRRDDSKQESKKNVSFMEYYNSIPQKKPSNILQRYIKRKK